MSRTELTVREIPTRLITGIRNRASLLAAAVGLTMLAAQGGTLVRSLYAIQLDPLTRFSLVQSWTGTFSLSGSGNGVGLNTTWQASQSANGSVVLDQSAPPHPATVGEWTGSNSGSASVNNSWTFPLNCFGRAQGAGSISSDLYPTPPRLSVSTDGTYLFTPGNLTVEAVLSGNCGMQTQTHRIMWGPAGTRGEGPVPVSGLVLAGSRQIRAAVPVFGLTPVEGAEINWTFSWNLQPGISADLVVEPTNYDTWRPEAGANEQSAGNDIQIRASLQTPSGSPSTARVSKIVFELLSVSTEPGIALNYPTHSRPSNAADLRFSGDGTASVVSSDGRRAETPEGRHQNATAVIDAFDWGAYGVLRVTALLESGAPIVGYLKDDRTQTEIRLPKRAEGSLIADVWKEQLATEQLADDDDSETLPQGDGHPGDGLTLYEEYRGFIENGKHIHGEPRIKEYFVFNEVGARAAQGIQLFETVTQLAVHGQFRSEEFPLRRVMNVNHFEGPHLVDQHGVWVKVQPGIEDAEAVGGPGTPGQVEYIGLPSDLDPGPDGWNEVIRQGRRFIRSQDEAGKVLTDLYASTVAHELLHAANVHHHGDGDLWEVTWTFDGTVVKESIGGVEAGAVDVREENGAPIAWPRNPADPSKFESLEGYVGVRQGEHSGVEDCIMRYDVAMAYKVGAIRYLVPNELTGITLCRLRTGTGVNAASRLPRPRYGRAEQGNCGAQVCVNDAAHTSQARVAQLTASRSRPRRQALAVTASEDVAPEVFLSVNGSSRATLFHNWPLIVDAMVVHPGPATAGPLTIGPRAGSWTNQITLEVIDSNGVGRTWPLHHVSLPPGSLVLDNNTAGETLWTVDPDDVAGLPEGDYQVVARLDTTAATSGWHGVMLSVPVTVQVRQEPVSFTRELEAETLGVQANYYRIHDQDARALETLETLIARQPDSLAGLAWKADILASMGETTVARRLYDRAISAFGPKVPGAKEPPRRLLTARRALFTLELELPPPPDTLPPIVVPPASITIAATEGAGARPSASTVLTGFLAGGSATDSVDPHPVRFNVQMTGVDVTASTLFAIGVNTVEFRFADATGNIGRATATVTVTPFVPRCAVDVTASMAITRSGFQLNRTTNRFVQRLTLTNTGTVAIAGPVAVAVDSLAATITLANAAAVTGCAAPAGQAVVVLHVGSANSLGAGESATVLLEFANPSGQRISYTLRVLAGSSNW